MTYHFSPVESLALIVLAAIAVGFCVWFVVSALRDNDCL